VDDSVDDKSVIFSENVEETKQNGDVLTEKVNVISDNTETKNMDKPIVNSETIKPKFPQVKMTVVDTRTKKVSDDDADTLGQKTLFDL
jgi:hypothetical protein